MQQLSLDKQLIILLNEAFDKRRLCALAFAVTSIVIISIGLIWPKKYVASTTILWNSASIIKPLVRGATIPSNIREQAYLAKEIIHGNKTLKSLIEKAGLDVSKDGVKLSGRDLALLKSNLRNNIEIGRSGDKIIRISYTDKLPEVAYSVVSIVTDLLINETILTKKTDTSDAYDFIDKQVIDYKSKLDLIQKNINDFKKKNVDLIDSSTEINSRVNAIKSDIKSTKSGLRKEFILKKSLEDQMAEESKSNVIKEAENIKATRLRALEDQLSTLRLSYTETYPDIVQLVEQIKNLKLSMERDVIRANSNDDSENELSNRGVSTPLYDSLKRQLSQSITNIKTLEARNVDNIKQLNKELGRSSKVNTVSSKIEELSRDYNVTKSIYDDFLNRRENARVSLNIELEEADSTYRVQEPPSVPLLPSGLRFLHFAVGSVIVGAGLPLALILGLLIIDPRIRHEEYFDDDDFPVLGVVPIYHVAEDLKKTRLITIQSVMIFVLAGLSLIAIAMARFLGYL